MGLFRRTQLVPLDMAADVEIAPRVATVAVSAPSDTERLRFAVQIILDAQLRTKKQPCCERLSILEQALARFNEELGV